jgi:thiol-disulfide isomerase/thioredoxin
MAATESTMRPLGTPCPAFDLPDVTTGNQVSNAKYAGKPLLVAFICNHCPFVQHMRDELARLSREAPGMGYGMVLISSNDVRTHPQDGPDAMASEASDAGYRCPYLYDETQDVARAFGAACTPDFFLFDAGHRLAYRGQLDDSRPSNGKPVTGADVRAAISAVLEGKAPAANQRPSIGCNIKWRAESTARAAR